MESIYKSTNELIDEMVNKMIDKKPNALYRIFVQAMKFLHNNGRFIISIESIIISAFAVFAIFFSLFSEKDLLNIVFFFIFGIIYSLSFVSVLIILYAYNFISKRFLIYLKELH